MIGKKFVLIIGMVFVLCSACSLPVSPAPTAISSSPTPNKNQTVQPETPLGSTTIPSNSNPTPEIPGNLETALPADPPLSSVDFAGMPQAVLEYLNNGSSRQDLEQALEGIAANHNENSLLSGDLDGNQKNDLVVSILDPDSQSLLQDSALLIYLVTEEGYELRLNRPYQGSPYLWVLQDLDADGRDDLVVSQRNCGAHTCFEDAAVLSWDGVEFVNRFDGSSTELPAPVIQAQDPDGDQVFQLDITGSEYGSVGAGPTRLRTWIWTYDPGSWHWQKTEEVLGKPEYRIHMLQDAEDSVKNGGYDQALLLYERVVGDSLLQDWIDPVLEQANLGAYARFKMFLIYLMRGEEELAQIVYADLAASFPAGSPQHAFVEMADAFQQGFSNHDPVLGCSEVEKYAATHSDAVLAPLNSFGYANPTYTPLNLCLPTSP